MIERKIVTGLIISTDFIKQILPIWNIQLLESTSAKCIAKWVMEYYDKFNRAPEYDLQGIFYQKLKENNLSKENAEDIEDILNSLSKEYEEDKINIDFLIEQTIAYFQSRRLSIYKEKIESLVDAGHYDEAEKIAAEYRINFSDPKTDLNNFIQSVVEIRKHERPKPLTLMKPWLKEGQTTILYGNYGCGKSLLSICIAYLMGLKEYAVEEAEIGSWQIKSPTGTLYIDGELGEQDMEERISQFEWVGVQKSMYRMRILSIPEYQIATEDQFYLSNRVNQLKIINWLKEHENYKLIILDSVSTLFGLVEENDNSEWSNKVNPFLRDLRALNVACLLLHHSGKEGKRGLRGASAMGAMAHNIYKLQPHPEKNIDDGEAWFTIFKDKQRSAGFQFNTFSIRFEQTNNGKETHWEVTDNK